MPSAAGGCRTEVTLTVGCAELAGGPVQELDGADRQTGCPRRGRAATASSEPCRARCSPAERSPGTRRTDPARAGRLPARRAPRVPPTPRAAGRPTGTCQAAQAPPPPHRRAHCMLSTPWLQPPIKFRKSCRSRRHPRGDRTDHAGGRDHRQPRCCGASPYAGTTPSPHAFIKGETRRPARGPQRRIIDRPPLSQPRSQRIATARRGPQHRSRTTVELEMPMSQ